MDEIRDVAVSPDGSVYLAGETTSKVFPDADEVNLITPDGTTDLDAFVVKIGPGGAGIEFVTVIGGVNRDSAYGVAIYKGRAVLVGHTASSDFPTRDPVQKHKSGGVDGFVAILSDDGAGVEFGSFIGGSRQDRATDVVLARGSLWTTGFTLSNDLPVKRAQQKVRRGSSDLFLTRIPLATWAPARFTTYIGGDRAEFWPRITRSDNSVVIGATSTSKVGLGAKGRFPTKAGKQDGLIVLLNLKGRIVRSSFIGGTDADALWSLSANSRGQIGIVGVTHSRDLPRKRAFQRRSGGEGDAYITVFSKSLRKVSFSSYLGGTGTDVGWGIASLGDNRWAVAGETLSGDFPIHKAVQDEPHGECVESSRCTDAFIASFSANGDLRMSSFWGGMDYDRANALTSEGDAVYMTGLTWSADFPSVDPDQALLYGTIDGFLTLWSGL